MVQITPIYSKKEDPVKAVMELTDKMGADAVIDFVNASKTVETDMQFLRKRAKLVLVGLFGGELKIKSSQYANKSSGHIWSNVLTVVVIRKNANIAILDMHARIAL